MSQFVDFLQENNFTDVVISTLIGIPISKFVDELISKFILPRTDKLLGINQDNDLHAIIKMIVTLMITLLFVYFIFLYIDR